MLPGAASRFPPSALSNVPDVNIVLEERKFPDNRSSPLDCRMCVRVWSPHRVECGRKIWGYFSQHSLFNNNKNMTACFGFMLKSSSRRMGQHYIVRNICHYAKGRKDDHCKGKDLVFWARKFFKLLSEMAQDTDRWRALVNAAWTFGFHKIGQFLD
jgi:hypothetical protein